MSYYLDLIIFSGVFLISDEKLLNSLNKCDKLFGVFNTRHESF